MSTSDNGNATALPDSTNTTVFTPTRPDITNLLQTTNSYPNTNDNCSLDGEPQPKRSCFIQLTPKQYEHILSTCSQQQQTSSLTPSSNHLHNENDSSTRSVTPSTPSYYNNAKYEVIACKAMKPAYNGSEEERIPFLTLLDIRRQNKGWAPATYHTITQQKT